MSIFGKPLIPAAGYDSPVYGSTFLKSLQTEKLPELDLLVRESIQNSSDASIGLEGKNFRIDYRFEAFNPEKLFIHLGEVGNHLSGKYSSGSHFLEIRDSKTSGLTGPYKRDELIDTDHGNYYKLVFDSGINQTQEGAGGNWGFGKSVYYRVSGAGIVIYYTKIADNGLGFPEERLIVTMVEDQSSENSILRELVKNPTGRAWWGRDGLDEGVVWPVTSHDAIKEFLDIFGLEPFDAKDTGTSVIIPFIDEVSLLEDVIPSDGATEDELDRCIWKDSVSGYLIHAIQKWYAPRLRNKHLEELGDGSKWIRATVNGTSLKNDRSMNPVFKIVQELYNTALFKCKGKDYGSDVAFVKCKDVNIRKEGLSRENAGYVAYVKLTSREIYGAQAGISPYILSGNFKNNDDENEPIVMFAREPGMVIAYSVDGTWSKNVKAPAKNAGSSDDEYIFAFFVPRVDNEFEEGSEGLRRETYFNLGGYLRKCEESDHASWEDKAKFKLIGKIKAGVARKIADGMKSADASMVTASASRLSGWIGKALMPPRGYATTPKKKPNGGGFGGSGGSGVRMYFNTGAPNWEDGLLVLPFAIGMGEKGARQVRIEAQSEGGAVSPEAWVRDIGTTFPVAIESATIRLSDSIVGEHVVSCGASSSLVSDGPIAAEIIKNGQSPTLLRIKCEIPGKEINGFLKLRTSDKTIELVVKAV
ncbi:hypothetical protein [Raoultibacter timonensis]|uniref:hypothetical protein n=1 Tax=Raoultibacter timonensis TaxID=1907662 RepID=UPI0026DC5F79|nr:hypothetical protein [Raoultibacter timonensis]